MEKPSSNKANLVIQFWQSFLEKEPEYYFGIDNEEDRIQLFYDLELQIKKFNEDLLFKFSKINADKKRDFVISANGMEEAFEDVRYLVEKAPRHKNWNFIAFSQRHPSTELEISMGDDITIGYNDLFFRYILENNRLGVELNIRNFQETTREQNAIFILLDCLLGEYDVTTKISYIEWVKLEEDNISDLLPFIELIGIVDELS